MDIGKNRTVGALMGVVWLGLLVSSPATSGVECGDTVTGAAVRIDDHIGPCAENPALTIQGPANVNFNGFTLECASAGTTGIVITGQNAKVQNGTVLNCEDGIEITGDGQHQVLKMRVTSDQVAGDRGFRVRSDDNHLVQNMAEGFNGEGFRVEGEGNRLVNNQAVNNSGHGFRLRGNGEHELVNNLAEGNGEEGVRIDSDGNRLVNNVAINNGDEGFRARDGAGNTLINNRAEGNGATDGEAGFRVQSDENLLRNNTAVSNVGDGILLYVDQEEDESAENNEIAHNTADDNGGTDLVDQNPDCDNNVWFKNRYGTRNQDCVD
jgi:parallel beta-helix repeat protein